MRVSAIPQEVRATGETFLNVGPGVVKYKDEQPQTVADASDTIGIAASVALTGQYWVWVVPLAEDPDDPLTLVDTSFATVTVGLATLPDPPVASLTRAFSVSTGEQVSARVNGIVKNFGDVAVYYRDEPPVDAAANDGSIAASSTVELAGTRWFTAAGDRRAPSRAAMVVFDPTGTPPPPPLTPPTNTVRPAITGFGSYGETVSVSTGEWTSTLGHLTFAYQWTRNGASIGGATSSTYVIAAADSAALIGATVTAHDTDEGSTSAPVGATNPLQIATFFFASSSTGSNANTGVDAAHPVQTVAKLRTLMTTGSQGLLLRGDRWFETMTIPGPQVRLGAYGAAPTTDGEGYVTNAPILDGGAFVTGWSTYSGGAEVREVADDFTGTANTDLVGHTPNVGTDWAKHLNFSAATNTIIISNANRVRRKAGTSVAQYYADPILGGDDYYVMAKVFVASTDADFVEVQARGFSYTDKGYFWRLSGASGTLSLGYRVAGAITNAPAGTFGTVAAALGSYAASTSYDLKLEVNAGTIKGYIATSGGAYTLCNTWSDITVPDGDHVMLRIGGTTVVAADDTHGLHVDHFEQGPLGTVGSPVNTFQATTTPQVYTVDMDNAVALKGPNPDQLANGEWFWTGNKLYVRRNAGVPGNTDVIRNTLDYGVNVGNYTDVLIDGIAFEHQGHRAITSTSSAQRLTIQNCMVQRSGNAETGENGVINSQAKNFTLKDCVIRDTNNDGLYCNYSGLQNANPTITGNSILRFTGFAADGVQIDATDGFVVNSTITGNTIIQDARSPKGTLILFGDYHLVEDNYLQGSGVDSINTGSYGLSMPGNHFTVRNNFFYNTANQGIRTATPALTSFVIEHNIFVDCGQAIDLQNAVNGAYIYANTMVNKNRAPVFRGVAAYTFNADLAVSGEFKDNIVWDASGANRAVELTAACPSFLRDYNLIGPQAAAFYKEAGTSYATLAAVLAARSQESHSLSSNPTLANLGGVTPDGSDYVPQGGSPAIGAGQLVAGIVFARDIGAKPVSAPPAVPPDNATVPSVSGFAIRDQVLTVNKGSWISGAAITYTYQWVRCNSSGVAITDIAGAVSTAYVCASADVGFTLRCRVTATNTFGFTSVTTAPTGAVAGVITVATGADWITDNMTGSAGTLLSAHAPDTGSAWQQHPAYSGNPDPGYQATSVLTAANRARVNGGAGVSVTSGYKNLTTPPSAEYDLRATLYVGNDHDANLLLTYRSGICARMDATLDRMYLVRYSGVHQAWELMLFPDTVLDSFPTNVSANQSIALLFLVRDAIKRVYIDGTVRLESGDNTITAAGLAGVRLGDGGGTDTSGLQIDSFRAVTYTP